MIIYARVPIHIYTMHSMQVRANRSRPIGYDSFDRKLSTANAEQKKGEKNHARVRVLCFLRKNRALYGNTVITSCRHDHYTQRFTHYTQIKRRAPIPPFLHFYLISLFSSVSLLQLYTRVHRTLQAYNDKSRARDF